MPFDRVANRYWGTVTTAPGAPGAAQTIRVPNPEGADFADLTLPFLATIGFPGNHALTPDGETAEVVYVTEIIGNVLVLDRFVPEHLRREIRAGDEISATLVTFS